MAAGGSRDSNGFAFGRDWAATAKGLFFGTIVGVLGGLGAVLFHVALQWVSEHLFMAPAGYWPPEPAGEQVVVPEVVRPVVWLFILIPALGGLVAGLLIHGLCREARGEGTNGMIRSFHTGGGNVDFRVFWVKLLASVATIGSGGSAGREGPSTQIGGAIGSSVARWFRLSDRDRRILLLAGAAAGVGAIFRAPLGGALFATEVLYRDTDSEGDALIPCLVAAIVGYSVFIALLGTASIFAIPPGIGFNDPLDIFFHAGLGVLCAGVGYLFVHALRVSEAVFGALRLWGPVRPALGGGLLGCCALLVGAGTGDLSVNVLGGGHGLIQAVLDSRFTLGVLVILLGGKILATALTVGSGGSGGLFAPSLVIGALLGGLVGQGLSSLGLVADPESFALVGMAGFFAGVGKVPIAAVVMVCEITKSYDLLAPIMMAVAVSCLLSRPWTLFGEQVASRIESPAHAGDFVVDVLEQLRVRDVFDPRVQPTMIHESTPLRRVLTLVAQSDSRYFPVIDEAGRMTGIFSLTDIRRVMNETELADLVLAKEIASEDVLKVTPDDDLNTALKRFTMKNIDEMPVVAPDDPRRVLGLLSRKDVIGAYGRRMATLRGLHQKGGK